MRKKLLLFFTVISVTVLTAACGTNDTPQTPTATIAPTQVAEPTAEPTQATEPAATPTAEPTAEPTKAIENTEPTALPTKAPEKELTNDPVPTVEEAYSLAFSRYTGVYGKGFGLAMAASEETAEIYYTLDGSDPETSATAIKYTAAVPVVSRTGEANVVVSIIQARIPLNVK